MLRRSYFKMFVVVPILALATAFMFLLFIYWSITLQRYLLYSSCFDIEHATHLMMYSTRKQSEIVSLKRSK